MILSTIFGGQKKEQVTRETSKKTAKKSGNGRFFIYSTYGELLDLAMHLKMVEKKEVIMFIADNDYRKIGEGIIDKAENWHDYLGQGWIFVVDGCETAKLQDWLRNNGEHVVGTNETMAEYENDRQKGQDLFKKAGFMQPNSKNFIDIESAIKFVDENKEKRFILKQNGDAPKSLNHMGKFPGNEDMLYHLEGLKKKWNEASYGKFDCDLMEVVEGTEIAVSAFFNGHDWLRDNEGRAVGFINVEHKKTNDGDLGSTCGEMGTLFLGVNEDNETFKDIMIRPEIIKVLKDSDYRGVFDINGCMTDDGYVAFEPTSRFGIPATSYEFMEGLKSSTADLLAFMARGEDGHIEVVEGWGMAQVIVSKPFPVEADIDGEATSIGEKLWILKGKKPVSKFSDEQMKHIHLENFYFEDGDYKVATKNGYLLVVTGTGKTIEETRENLLEYIKENIYIPEMSYRQDLGKKFEEAIG